MLFRSRYISIAGMKISNTNAGNTKLGKRLHVCLNVEKSDMVVPLMKSHSGK